MVGDGKAVVTERLLRPLFVKGHHAPDGKGRARELQAVRVVRVGLGVRHLELHVNLVLAAAILLAVGLDRKAVVQQEL